MAEIISECKDYSLKECRRFAQVSPKPLSIISWWYPQTLGGGKARVRSCSMQSSKARFVRMKSVLSGLWNEPRTSCSRDSTQLECFRGQILVKGGHILVHESDMKTRCDHVWLMSCCQLDMHTMISHATYSTISEPFRFEQSGSRIAQSVVLGQPWHKFTNLSFLNPKWTRFCPICS